MLEDDDVENPSSEERPLMRTPDLEDRATTSQSTSKSSWIYIVLVSVCFVLLAAALFFVYYDLHQSIREERLELKILQKQFDDYRVHTSHTIAELLNEQSCTESNVKDMKKSLDTKFQDYNERISFLENMPSNSDVLDEVHLTERHLEQDMADTRKDVDKGLSKLQRNVTGQIALSKHYVKEKLRAVDDSIAASEERVDKLIADTYTNVSSAVRTADQHIRVMETNVTGKMASMSQTVFAAVQSVSELVESAKSDIYGEVQAVHDSMDQYIIFTNHQFAAENNFVKYQLAGSFSLLACLISLWHVTSHLRNNNNPGVQRRILAILWMVPIYSVTSWLALVFSSAQPLLAAFRDCYEAYVVYTFIAFLIAILANGGGTQAVIAIIARQQHQSPPGPSRVPDAAEEKGLEEGGEQAAPSQVETKELSAPCPCCIPAHIKQQRNARGVAASILWQCQTMAIQFVLLKPLLAATPFIIKSCGVDYDNHPPFAHGNIDWTSPRLYVLMVANISVSLAFYGLLSFYHLVAKELAWCDPWPKFLCIKGVVFFSFWQDILLQIMSGWGLIDSSGASQVQNLLICIEMFMASIAHVYVFPHHEWQKGYQREEAVSLFRDTLALPDFVTDVRQIASRDGWAVEDDYSSPGGQERRRKGSGVGSYGSMGQSARHAHDEGTTTAQGPTCVTEDKWADSGPAHDTSISSLEVSDSTLFRSTHAPAERTSLTGHWDEDTPAHWMNTPSTLDHNGRSGRSSSRLSEASLSRSDCNIDAVSVGSSSPLGAPCLSSPFQSDLSLIGSSQLPAISVNSSVTGAGRRVKSPTVILHGSDEESSVDEDSVVGV